MKKLQNLFIFYFIQILVILFVSPLSKSSSDKILLIACSGVFLFIFCLGLLRMLRDGDISQSRYNARYFGSMGLRMIIGLSTIGIYLAISEVKNLAGSIFLLISYFVYMGFEIRIILHKLRTDSEKSRNADNARK